MSVWGVLGRLFVVGMVCWWALSGGPLQAVGEWLLAVYLIWRAIPGIRPDVARVSKLFSKHGKGLLSGRGSEGRL